ncbi:hypothetical protein CHN50_05110 [Priestia aryabhattai]|nr:hypothetical protein CHN50_05110 [Priestia aryabhattai]
MSMLKSAPVPYFTVDRNLKILNRSKLAMTTFASVDNFLEVVDTFSKEKAKKYLRTEYIAKDDNEKKENRKRTTLLEEKEYTAQKVELVLQTEQSPYALFECFIQWDEGVGHLVCLHQDERIKELTKMVQAHQKRLAHTDFELLQQKERLEASLKRIKQLSASFIKLSEKVALIPLFGDLDEQLVAENSKVLQDATYDGHYSIMLFDFSGINELKPEGIHAFSSFTRSFDIMGVTCYIIGMKPSHTEMLKGNSFGNQIIYMNNLSDLVNIKHSVG